MRKNLLTLSLVISLIAPSILYAQLPNGGFENWTTVSYQDPVGWYTGNRHSVSRMGMAPVSRVTGHTGYGLRIETFVAGPDTSDPYITNSINDPLNGDGGVPFPEQPTRISGYYRCNLVGNDTALMVVIFKSGGAIISTDIFKFTGSVNTYTYFQYALSLGGIADTMIFAATSSNLLNNVGVQAGSWLELDGLDLQVTTQVPNGAFENWDSLNYESPNGWHMNGDSIFKSTDHFAGSYSIKMVTQDYGGGNVQSAYITTGRMNGPGGGLPYNFQNDTLIGYYKFIPSGGDSASVNISVTNHGTIVGGNGRFLAPASNYTLFKIGFTSSLAPDTMRIDFSSSKYPISPSSVGSTLYLDGLILRSVLLGTQEIGKTPSNMLFTYPNPATDVLNISFMKNPEADFGIMIYNVSGSLVKSERIKFNSSGYVLNIADLPAGTYFLESISREGHYRNSFIKQ